LRKNLAAAKLGILSQLEYRVNYLIDALVQPMLSTTIEVTLWMALLKGMGMSSLGGFGREYYLAYALWATFVGRITTNWMYEFNMLDDIDSGKVNSILVRPISFYEFYLSQFLGYKVVTVVASFVLPLAACLYFRAPVIIERLPLMLLLLIYYLIFAHTISFCVACLAFFINRAHAFTGMKNMIIWAMAGELIPLDLYPEPLRTWLIRSPFATGVYIPVGYITGRFDTDLMLQSFVSVTVGIGVAGALASYLWWSGVKAYTGTGA
jgi:ABC-2 type transport system permease protein